MPRLNGASIEQQCAIWQRTANELEQQAIRLRKLIADAERYGERSCCPWCDRVDHRGCPAFSARGVVR